MAWFRALERWARVAAVGSAALATLGCELLPGIDDRSTAGSGTSSGTATTTGSGSGGGAGSATGSMSGPTSGTGGTGGTGGAGACPVGYEHCDPSKPTACQSVNSMQRCGTCDMPCEGACIDGNCDPTFPLDNLLLWLRADAGVETEGDVVTTWYSEVGAGAAFATFDATRPKLGTMGPRPAVVFDGMDDYLELPSLGDCAGLTIFIAFSPEVEAPALLLRFGTGNPPYNVALYHQAGADLVYDVLSQSEPPCTLTTCFFQEGAHTVAAMNDGNGTVAMWLDAQRNSTVTMGGAPALVTSLEFGMLSSQRGPWLQGKVAEIMV